MTSRLPPMAQPTLTYAGNGSLNIPRLHFRITNSSVMIVASNNQVCWPIRTVFLCGVLVRRYTTAAKWRNVPWIVDVLIKLSHRGQPTKENTSQPSDNNRMIRFHPQQTLNKPVVGKKTRYENSKANLEIEGVEFSGQEHSQ